MKKFLTVLLVIAVMFTFSFGSAFAATGTGAVTYTHAEAVAKAQADLISAFTENAAAAKAAIAKETEYVEVFGSHKAHIPASFYTDAVDMLVADYTKYVNEATNNWNVDNAASTETDPDAIKAEIINESVDDIYVRANNKFAVENSDFPATANEIVELILKGVNASNNLEYYYAMQIWAAALDTIKAEIKAEIAKVDMSLYTDDVISTADYRILVGDVNATNAYKITWKGYAEKVIADIISAIDNTSINPTKDLFGQTKTALGKLCPVVATAGAGTAGIVQKTTVTDIYGNTIITSYKLADTNIKTAADLNGEAATDAARVAAAKATIQSSAADVLVKALRAYNTEYATAANDAERKVVADNYAKAQKMVNAWVEVNTYLVEEGNAAAQTTLGLNSNANPTLTQITNATNLLKALAKTDLFETAKDQAAAAKIAVDKDGALKYDAETIDENLDYLKESVYDGTVTTADGTYAAIIDGAEAGAADTTPWLKEVAIAQVKKDLEAALYNEYYDIEEAKVQAKYDALLAKIEAAATKSQLKSVLGATNYGVLTGGAGTYNFVTLTGINDKTAVNTAVGNLGNFASFVDSVNTAVDYLNWGIKSYEDGYRAKVTSDDDKAAVKAFLAKNGVRTYTDLTANAGLAKEYAESLPTNGEKKAAQAEFDAMIKALPTVITFADKEQIAEAYAFADDNGFTSTKLATAVTLVKAAEQKEIDKLFAALPATITVADKEAVKAAIAAEDAYEATAMYNYAEYKNYTAKFEALRAAEKAAVEKQIALLPVDTTRSEVDAAKAAVDAFVAEYKDAGYDLVGYEAVLSNDAESRLAFAEAYVETKEIKAVESLKITASSAVKKGSITVKWTVEGDAAAADGYEVYRSTKKNSGFGKTPIFETTKTSYKNTKGLKKGTRYYYKVRAYKVVDDQKIYSDWSNKAYRVAK